MRHEILVEGALETVGCLEPPVTARPGVVHVLRPRVHDRLATRVWRERDLLPGKGCPHHVGKLTGARAERAHVVDVARERFGGGVRQGEQGLDRVRHRHEGNTGIFPDETGVGPAQGRRVDHLGRVVAGAPARHRERRDQTGEADGPEVHAARAVVRREMTVVTGEVATEVLAVELVAAIHR